MCIVPNNFENAHGVGLVLWKCGTDKLKFHWQRNDDNNTISYGAGDGGARYVMNVAGTRPLFNGIGINLSKYFGWKRQHWERVPIDEEGLNIHYQWTDSFIKSTYIFKKNIKIVLYI